MGSFSNDKTFPTITWHLALYDAQF